MSRRSAAPLLALATVMTCLAAAAGPSLAQRAHAAAQAPLGGVNITGVGPQPLSYADRAIAQAHALHAQVVRTEVPWSEIEPLAAGMSHPT